MLAGLDGSHSVVPPRKDDEEAKVGENAAIWGQEQVMGWVFLGESSGGLVQSDPLLPHAALLVVGGCVDGVELEGEETSRPCVEEQQQQQPCCLSQGC